MKRYKKRYDDTTGYVGSIAIPLIIVIVCLIVIAWIYPKIIEGQKSHIREWATEHGLVVQDIYQQGLMESNGPYYFRGKNVNIYRCTIKGRSDYLWVRTGFTYDYEFSN